MSERHWPRPALATTALALLGATAVAGCGGGSASSTGQASATETAGVAATTGHKAITADQLKGALLTKVGSRSWPRRHTSTPPRPWPSQTRAV